MTKVINFLRHRLREVEREGGGGAVEARMVIIRSRPTDLFTHRQQQNTKIVCIIWFLVCVALTYGHWNISNISQDDIKPWFRRPKISLETPEGRPGPSDDDIYIMVECMSVCLYVTFLLILPSPCQADNICMKVKCMSVCHVFACPNFQIFQIALALTAC